MGHKALTALQTATLTVQSKVIQKLLQKGVNNNAALSRCNIISKDSADNINHIHNFIALQSSQENAKKIIDDGIKIISKLSVLYFNDLFTESEEEIFVAMVDAERDLAECFLTITTDDVTPLVQKMAQFQEKVAALLGERFSQKTVSRAQGVCDYFSEDVFRFLLTEASAEEGREAAKGIMGDITRNHSIVVEFLAERSSKNRRMKKLKKMSSKVQAAAFASLEKELEEKPGSLRPSSEMITEEGMVILSGIQRFIELESKDERKGEELICSIVTIMAKVEAAYKAERFTDADQEELVFLISVARSLLEIYTGQPGEPTDISKLEEHYEHAEEHLCNILRSHFDGDTLARVKSLFYYFKKPDVNMFFFKELKSEMRETIVKIFRKMYRDLPVTFLTHNPELPGQ